MGNKVPEDCEWKLTTFDDEEYYLTQKEYDYFKKCTMMGDVKIIHFDLASIAVSNIKRVERVVEPTEAEQVPMVEKISVLNNPKLGPVEDEESN